MKFAMGADTLTTLSQKTSSSHEDLGGLVKKVFGAAEPLYNKFNGSGRAAFDLFHDRTNEIADDLNGALAAVLGGIQGQNRSFTQGDQNMAEGTQSLAASANFEAAKFHGGH